MLDNLFSRVPGMHPAVVILLLVIMLAVIAIMAVLTAVEALRSVHRRWPHLRVPRMLYRRIAEAAYTHDQHRRAQQGQRSTQR